MAEKKTHFGRAGEYFAMSELLLRGWNVAVPVVDVGDDIFVIDDNDKTTLRLQVKSAEAKRDGDSFRAKFNLSRRQLRTPQRIELIFMLVVRTADGWRFLVIPREALFAIRSRHVAAAQGAPKIGRPPTAGDDATTDTLGLEITISPTDASAWSASMTSYLDSWPDALPVVKGGPGTVGATVA